MLNLVFQRNHWQCYIKHLLNLRYCNTTWVKCGQQLICKLQTLQNRAARVVTGIKYEEADHDLLLASLGWMNVKHLVYYDTASLMYKITDGTAPEYTQSMFNKYDTIHSYETRSVRNGNFITPKIKSAKGQRHLCILVHKFGIVYHYA